jgi:excinuclease ABC subunit C
MKQMHHEMMAFAARWEFENAQRIKEKLEILDSFRGKSVVVNPILPKWMSFPGRRRRVRLCEFIRVMEGAVTQAYTVEINQKFDKSSEDLLWMECWPLKNTFGTLNPILSFLYAPDKTSGLSFYGAAKRR